MLIFLLRFAVCSFPFECVYICAYCSDPLYYCSSLITHTITQPAQPKRCIKKSKTFLSAGNFFCFLLFFCLCLSMCYCFIVLFMPVLVSLDYALFYACKDEEKLDCD